jgi:hypothetical protein
MKEGEKPTTHPLHPGDPGIHGIPVTPLQEQGEGDHSGNDDPPQANKSPSNSQQDSGLH